jgi:histidyl-tRNA synthetase
VSQGAKAESMALFAVRELRQAGHTVELDHSGAGFSKQLKRASRSKANWAVLIGEEEALIGEVILKNMRDTSETNCSIDVIANIIAERLK